MFWLAVCWLLSQCLILSDTFKQHRYKNKLGPLQAEREREREGGGWGVGVGQTATMEKIKRK